ILSAPLSDGGEGMSRILTEKLNGTQKQTIVTGPLDEQIEVSYGIIDVGKTAVMNVASVIGLPLVPPEKRNPLKTVTHGIGELIKIILNEGVGKIIIGLGGSSTVDGGTGIVQALGAEFYDGDIRIEKMCGASMLDVTGIDMSEFDERIHGVQFIGACDVRSPLLGLEGAAYVYGPQKGASPDQVMYLEKGLINIAKIITEVCNKDVSETPGAGAAGGIGACMAGFFKAELVLGIDLVIELLNIEEMIKEADLIFTGEGKFDSQTSAGKAVSGIVNLAKKYKKSVALIAGIVDPSADRDGLWKIESLVSDKVTPEIAMRDVIALIEKKAEKLLKKYINK
ncbi:glycerate kinase, partial [candidate division KSB1 bacterium]